MPKSFLLKRYIKSELKPDEEPWTLSASLNDSWVSRRNMNGVSHIPVAFQFENSPEKNGIENREEDTERLENNGNVNHQINTADAKRSLPREKAVGTERKQIYESQLNSRTALVQPSKLHRKPLAEDLPCKPPYRCDQCGKIFKTKYTLTIHLKMPSHTGARPFVCGVCGKGFRLSSTLCRHKIIHTSDKPHKCNICQKAFNRSSTLKTHVRTHSETKEFTCDLCGKGFHQKGNLRNHTLIHTGEKPYKCTLCEKAFNKLSNLKFHLHVHTDNAPYRCRHCKVHFSRRCDLKEHISARHKNT